MTDEQKKPDTLKLPPAPDVGIGIGVDGDQVVMELRETGESAPLRFRVHMSDQEVSALVERLVAAAVALRQKRGVPASRVVIPQRGQPAIMPRAERGTLKLPPIGKGQ